MSDNTDFAPPAQPWLLFKEWFALAEQCEVNDPNAMALATVGSDGTPHVRVVLMKGFNQDGVSFFTNRESQKARDLNAHPQAALCFHWKSLRRQVRIVGAVKEISDLESDAYFATRPRQSQLGAWASQQSRPLPDRKELIIGVQKAAERFIDGPVPRPPYWGGYILLPTAFEFWQDREFRLHDRIVYKQIDVDRLWSVERLYP